MFKIAGKNYFINNQATLQGGAIYWDELEPIFTEQTAIFDKNSVGYYGNNIACFG